MNVVECCAGVGTTELLFCDFWRVARVHDEGRNGVPESMKTASRNIERVEDWPKPTELGLVQAQLDELLAVVQLYQALGGGWQQ
jgi:hypothetical protein